MTSPAQSDTRAEPDAATGLTAAEVAERRERGDVNAYRQPTSRPVSAILRANVLTRFNALLGSLLVVILIVGPLQDALFGLVLVSNAAVGIIQELRAKRTLDRLTVITAPRARALRDGSLVAVAAEDVVLDDVLDLGPGDQVVVDAVVSSASGLALDESMLTGESHAVTKAAGDTVLSGSFVVSGSGRCRVTAVGEQAYAAQLARHARVFAPARSELRDGINLILRFITWILVPTAALLIWSQLTRNDDIADAMRGSVAGTVTMIPEGLVLLTSLAFAVAVIRLARKRVLARELPAVEGLARVDTLCIDKTGTLTTGGLRLSDVERLDPGAPVEAALAALAAADEHRNATMTAVATAYPSPPPGWAALETWPFTSATKWSGIDFGPQGIWLLGAPDVLVRVDDASVGTVRARAEELAATGARVVMLGRATARPDSSRPPSVQPTALLVLLDDLRPDAAETLAYLRSQGVAVKVISGDHPATVAALVNRLGIDAGPPVDARTLPEDRPQLAAALAASTVFGRVTPEQKRAMVAALQSRGHVVAMTGDGVNDILALKDADLGIAMGSGSGASRAVAQLVLLDDSFTAVPMVIGEGRRVIANIERVANLFLTKTVYATVLAITVGVARLPFPFLPRHLTLVSTLTIGLPGFILALAPNARRAQSHFLWRVTRFSVPAGLIAAGATFLAYSEARNEPGTSLTSARTLAALVLLAVALWVLSILVRSGGGGQRWLVPVMAAGFGLVLVVPAWREFFALSVPRPLLWFAAIGTATVAGVALEFGWRAAHQLRRAGPTVRTRLGNLLRR